MACMSDHKPKGPYLQVNDAQYKHGRHWMAFWIGKATGCTVHKIDKSIMHAIYRQMESFHQIEAAAARIPLNLVQIL